MVCRVNETELQSVPRPKKLEPLVHLIFLRNWF